MLLLYFINSMAEQQLSTLSTFRSFPRKYPLSLHINVRLCNSIIPPFSRHTNRVAWTRKLVESGRVHAVVLVNKKERRIIIIIIGRRRCVLCATFTSSLPSFTKHSGVSSNGSFYARMKTCYIFSSRSELWNLKNRGKKLCSRNEVDFFISLANPCRAAPADDWWL